jgi:hypothetical protein
VLRDFHRFLYKQEARRLKVDEELEHWTQRVEW